MAVQKQSVPIPLGSLDTKTDPKTAPVGKLLVCENAYRQRTGEYRKKDGTVLFTQNTNNAGTLPSMRTIGTLDNQLLTINETEFYSYSDSAPRWMKLSNVTGTSRAEGNFASVDSDYITSGDINYVQSDAAHVGNYSFYAQSYLPISQTARSTIRLRQHVKDNSTGTVVLSNLLSGQSARVVAAGTKVFIAQINAGVISIGVWDSAAPNVTPTYTTLASDFRASTGAGNYSEFDLCAQAGKIFVGYANDTNGVAVVTVDQVTLAFSSTLMGSTANTCSAVALYADGTNIQVAYAFAVAVPTVIHETRSNAMAVVNIANTVMSNTSIFFGLTLVVVNSQITIFAASQDENGVNLQQVYIASRLTNGSSIVSGVVKYWGFCLTTKAFALFGKPYVGVKKTLNQEKGDFLVSSANEPPVRIQVGSATLNMPQILSSVQVGSGLSEIGLTEVQIKFASMYDTVQKTIQTVTTPSIVRNAGVVLNTVTYNKNIRINQFSGMAFVSGACPGFYDGAVFVENGFSTAPYITSVQAAGGNLTTTGTYNYAAIYTYVDANGLKYRSAPSNVSNVVLTGANQSVTVTYYNLCLTAKVNASIEIYRTANAGTTYNLVFKSAMQAVVNNSFTDGLSDASAAKNEVFYFPGLVSNDPVPAYKYQTVFKNRLVVAGCEIPNRVYFSKQKIAGDGINFNYTFAFDVDSKTSGITGLATLDDKLIIFKETEIFAVLGEGPTDAGTQNSFSLAEKLPFPMGCRNDRSIVVTETGVMFQTDKGMWIIDRGLNINYIGAPVEYFNPNVIVSAFSVPYNNQIRFMTTGNECLIYDTLFQEWYIYLTANARSGCVWKTQPTWLDTFDGIKREVPGTVTDPNAPIITRFVFSFLQFGNVQGFQRVFRILVLGEKRGDHTIRARLAYDMETIWSQTNSLVIDSAFGNNLVDASYYNNGGQVGPYQIEICPTRQRCESLQLELTDQFPGSASLGFTLSGLTAEVGILPGSHRLASTKRLT